ncbi:MAG: DUF1540 domain-containing protein [Christensenellaceae bacterium]
MDINNSICCDVNACRHNKDGRNCSLERIKVGCGCHDCTCCESFEE